MLRRNWKTKPFLSVMMFFCLVIISVVSSKIVMGQEKLLPEVDPNGALQYKYDIKLPPGTNGMGPSLALVYNSNAGNGMLGMGWMLNGFPTIERDSSRGITFDDAKDHYIYSGEKLIYSNPVQNGDGYYHTERESYMRIQFVSPNTADSHWVVTLKNGTKMYFGYLDSDHTATSDGHINAVGYSGKARVWALSKVMDVLGNYYFIEYNEDNVNGDYYPVRITYTKNEQYPFSEYRTVEFSYETRSDHYSLYNPSKVDLNERLKWIVIKGGGNLLEKYCLDYENGEFTGRSRLIIIKKYGNDGNVPPIPWVDSSYIPTGKVLPLLNFTWQNAETTFSSDGRMDFVELWDKNGKLSMLEYQSDSQGYQNINNNDLNQGSSAIAFLTGDVNGDGRSDIIQLWNNNDSLSIIVYQSDGQDYKYTSSYSPPGESVSAITFLTGDVNGDGLTDIIQLWDNNGKLGIIVYQSDGQGYQHTGSYRPDKGASAITFLTGDVNGDGRTDIMQLWNNNGKLSIIVYQSDGQGYQHTGSYNSGQGASAITFLTGDVNSDGLTDITQLWNNDGKLSMLIYQSDGQIYKYTGSYSTGQGANAITFLTGNVNGDSLTDIIQLWDNNGKLGIIVYQSNHQSYISTWGSTLDQGANAITFLTGDVNGDGLTDIIQLWDNNGKLGIIVYQSDGKGYRVNWIGTNENGSNAITFLPVDNNLSNSQDLLSCIHTIENAMLSITYKSLVDIPNAVQTSKIYPNIAKNYPQQIVTQLFVNDELGQKININYNYSNNMFHTGLLYERSSLGFECIEKTVFKSDGTIETIEHTYYRQDDIDYRGLVYKQEIIGSDVKEYLEKDFYYNKRSIITNTSGSSLQNSKFIYLEDEYAYNYNGETGTPIEARINYTYDDYGNLTQKLNYGDTSVGSDDVREETDYTINTIDGVLLPSAARKYNVMLNGQTGLTSETRLYYTNYLLTRKEFENGSQDVINTYDYDNYGNPILITDGNNKTTSISYDNTYQTLVCYTTNPLNQTKETVYDYLMRPIQVIDANGAITQTTYDEFSREKSTIAPGDTITYPTTRQTYPDEFIDTQTGKPYFPNKIKVEKKESDSSYLEGYAYSDGLGRNIQEKAEGKNGSWITIDHYYDSSGREFKTSMPYITASSNYSTPDSTVKCKWTEYDPVGRELKTHNSDGTFTQKVYGKQEILSIDEKGHVANKRKIGNTEYDISYTGVYPYQTVYATTTIVTAGDGKRVTDTLGNVLEINLDMLGRKVRYSDPDMGIWTYSYDANGNILSQTDAKSQTLVMEYDALNRLTKKTYPDLTETHFYYDETGHGFSKGRMTRMVYTGGEESYQYDARGRKTSITQTIDGISKTQSMAYDALDRIATQIYPDGETVNYTYDQGGNLSALAGNSTYVTNIDYAPYGKVSRIQYGNGVQTDYNYYDEVSEYDNSAGTYFSYRLKQINVSAGGGSILNLGYEYDVISNVKVKRDNINSNYTEEYSYDDLNRLLSSGSPAYGYKLYSYDCLNNITSKDSHTYLYGSLKPHAVTDDGRYTYTYDANGNTATRSDGRAYTWGYDNKLVAISGGGSFVYNPSGRRLKKMENGTTTLYFFATYQEEYQEGIKIKSIKYYFAKDQRVAEYSSMDGLRFYHQDHLGSSVAMTNINGTLIYRANYAPYGSDAFSQGSVVIKYKFTGQEKDDIGLYYYGARYYDPELGRFISPDLNLDGLNRYTYCNNNPVIYADPTGEFWWIVIGAAIGWYTGEKVADIKGISDPGQRFWYGLTGALIGGLAAWGGEAAYASAISAGNSTVIASGLGGAAGGFISGFGNSWAFSGEGTALFAGNMMDSFCRGLFSAFYGFGIGCGLGYLQETYLSTPMEGSIQWKDGYKPEVVQTTIGKARPDVVGLVQNITKSINYNSCTIINYELMQGCQQEFTQNGQEFRIGDFKLTGNIFLSFGKLFAPIVWDHRTEKTLADVTFAFDLTKITFILPPIKF